MPGAKQRQPLLEFTGEMQNNTSRFLPKKNEVRVLVNSDTERLGDLAKRASTTKKGNTMTSTSTSSTSTTTTSTSSSTSTSTTQEVNG